MAYLTCDMNYVNTHFTQRGQMYLAVVGRKVN